ncbi:WRKY DNA-binding protein 30 [Euphorbia peplus]|nr:WRKY DNA-binding protein 30 [Euphorbia peplus]
MESNWEVKKNIVVEELKNGKELTRQLRDVSSCSRETPEMLVQKIISSFEKTLSLLNFNSFTTTIDHPLLCPNSGMSDSPITSFSGSPQSEGSDRDQDGSRKRKSIARKKEQVRVNPGMELEGPLDDGYNWRKYGQKDILGAKYPRGYYKCTHRMIQGCLATKQVQRSDEDPFIFDITYYGNHTCTQNFEIFSPPQQLENQEPTTGIGLEPKEPQENHQQLSQELVFNFSSGLKVITDDLDSRPDQSFSSSEFQFPSTSDIFNVHNSQVFSPNYLLESSSSIYGGNQNFQTCESTTTTVSPSVSSGFPFDNIEFDPSFIFDN